MYIEALDWNTVWKEQMTRHIQSAKGIDCAMSWDNQSGAEEYWNMMREEQALFCDILSGVSVFPGDSVLDIGSGPGTVGLYFADRARSVTAVEPAEAMQILLKKNIKKCGFDNATIVPKRWEEVDPARDLHGPYDAVIASFSLGMTEIRDAIIKMCQVCAGTVYLLWFCGENSYDWNMSDLWPHLYGTQYRAMPGGEVLFNVLYQMGIYPNVEVFPFALTHRYASHEEAYAVFCEQLSPETQKQHAAIRQFLNKSLLETPEGVMLPYTSINMKLWWSVRRDRAKPG